MSKPTYYKSFTYDLRPPIQGGDVVWDGSLPYLLPEVKVDSGEAECAAGWNATRSIADCMRIAGFWRAPWPMRVFAVHSNGHELFERGDKVRSATWNIASECGLAEIESAIYQLSESWFAKSKLQSDMAREQFLWYRAFASSVRDESAIVAGLSAALEMRGLKWSLKKYPSETAAWDAWDAWDALSVYFTASMKWTKYDPNLLTTGIRDAYANGLLATIPTEENELGYVMKERP